MWLVILGMVVIIGISYISLKVYCRYMYYKYCQTKGRLVPSKYFGEEYIDVIQDPQCCNGCRYLHREVGLWTDDPVYSIEYSCTRSDTSRILHTTWTVDKMVHPVVTKPKDCNEKIRT